MSSNATTSIPSNAPGCWANSEHAVATCCTQLGGIRIPLPDSSIPTCAYNTGAKFTADDASTSPSGTNSTTFRWSSCIDAHFNATSDGSVILSTCENLQNQTATVTSVPSSTVSSGAEDLLVFRRSGSIGRGILAGIVVAGGLLHVLSFAL
ncbi:hypothetical protein B0H19DRAFT_1073101 [Mycena capillaripes]|nr:hypothetical protein B0H19DRAFT_1073101 [Mycena capillaripes]